ncbi:MAG: carboxypeptidase regulatory-like domain-containing protein [Thiobacillaceae bacterium]
MNSLVVYLDNSTTAKTLFVGLYSDSGGHPGTLLTQGSSTTLTSAAWNTVPVPAVNITTGTPYWMAVLGTGGTIRVRDGSGCTSVSSTQSNLSSLPANWSSGSSWPTCPLSAYGYGTSSSGGSGGSFSISGTITPTAGGSGASVTLSGSSSASTTTSGSGTFSFTGLTNGNYVVTPSNPGYTFVPPSQAVTINGAIQVGVNFTAAPAPVTYSLSGTISPASVGAGAIVTLSGPASASTTADSGGNFSFTLLNNGTYTITPSSTTATFNPLSQSVTINGASVSGVGFTATATSTVLFFDDFTGNTLDSTAWTVISRHGEYAQNETECNIPQQVSVANSLLTITAAVGPAICGDFNPDGSVRTPPSSWPYITGDVQWNTLNFTYGTVTIRAAIPPQATSLWPGIWLLGNNCQTTNKYSGDTGFGGCPNLGQSGYTEIDMVECYGSGWCQFHLANPGFGIGNGCDATYPVDTNFHVFQTVWTPTSIKQYMDGVLETTCNQSPANPMFLIMQIQTGGAGGTPNNTLLPANLQVDYVKVTQP